MNKPISIIALILLCTLTSFAQQSFKLWSPYPGNYDQQYPRSLYAHKNKLYFSITHPFFKIHELWYTDGNVLTEKLSAYGSGIFPWFEIIGSKGDSLIMLVDGKVNHQQIEGIYAFNLIDSLLYPISKQTGIPLSYNPAQKLTLLTEGDNVYYLSEVNSGRAIFCHNIRTSKTDTFCYLPNDTYGQQLIKIRNNYYLSIRHYAPAVPQPLYDYCHIYKVDTRAKQLGQKVNTDPAWLSRPIHMLEFYGDLYYAGSSAVHGSQLYKYTGSGQPQPIPVHTTGYNTYSAYFTYNWRIYFVNDDSFGNDGLYEYNPATGDTKFIAMLPVTGFHEFNQRLYLISDKLHVYDRVKEIRPIISDTKLYRPYQQFTNCNGKLFFTASDIAYKTRGQVFSFDDSLLGPAPTRIIDLPSPISVIAYPNPVLTDVRLKMSLIETTALSIELTDVNGRTMYRQTQQLYNSGEHSITLPMHGLAAGMYVYRITRNDGQLLYSGQLAKQ